MRKIVIRKSMRLGRRAWILGPIVLGAIGAGFGLSGDARAQQIDVNPPLPNAVILLDTSGSMEKMIDGNDPDTDGQACVYKYSGNNVVLNSKQTTQTGVTGTLPNRWGIAVQALTGDVSPVYNCVEMPRAKGGYFDGEYKINGFSPYDVDYFLPYRRPVAGGTASSATACVVAPNDLSGVIGGQGVGTPPKGTGGNATDWASDAIINRLIAPPSVSTSCSFTQVADGVLDSARDMIRFGLMTFDSDTGVGTGTTSTGLSVANTTASPFDGQWSYFNGWNNNGTGVQGEPADCTSKQVFEIGSRNPAAPPWEGRFITLPSDPNAPIATVEATNDQIQLAINAMRPYGATPTAGMFADAQYYFWTDPAGPQQTDPYVQGNCRDEYIIHITDGAPNLDLRPSCGATPIDPTKPGTCPYKLPENIATELATGGSGKHIVKTFVIGFAVSSVQDGNTLVKCSDLIQNGTLSGVCSDGTKQALYGPCCELQRIAIAGGTSNAYFADTAGDLNKALGAIIANIAQNTTTRTVPAYSPVVANPSGNNQSTTNSSLFLASFSPIPGQPWVGDVQRQRFQCTLNNGTYTVPPPVIDVTKGDDYADNLKQQGATRQFRTIKAEVVSGAVDSTATIRMGISASLPGIHRDDHLGTYGSAAQTLGTSATTIVNGLTAAHLNLTATSCANSLGNEWLTANGCKDLALNFGLAQGSTDPMPDATFVAFQSRASSPMADIFHATPIVVAPPGALLSDESYQAFASTWATRPTVLYTATNDGLLHAFDSQTVDDGSQRNTSELWAFMPPAVLPKLRSTYPGNHQLLLDGAPVVRDVVFDRAKSAGSLLLSTNWHTALVAGFGSQNRGYYALDITDPAPNTDLTKGPKFLWQMTNMPPISGNPDRALFGQHSGTPAITTVFVDLDGSGAHEVGVAILPGGLDNGAVGGKCKRQAPVGNDAEPTTGFTRRDYVRCWSATGQPVAGRSVTIVRLDTGEVLRTFSRWTDAPQNLLNAQRVGTVETPLDSPMTGIPLIYPSDAGAVAQKLFIGDADGTVWRFNLTDTNPQAWVGELYLDAYNQQVDNSSNAYDDGQPIAVSPSMALDRLGELVVTFATGDTESYTTTGNNFVYSTTEKVDTSTAKLRANVNWYIPFTAGERVSGPMAIFDSVLYFSTFAAGANAASCSGGVAKMFGRDYVNPNDANDLSKGGIPKLEPPVNPTNPPPDYILPGTLDPTLAGKVIPGVSVNFTPACATISSATDQYVGGSHMVADNVTSGSYSLVAPVAVKNNQGGVKVFGGNGGLALPSPKTSTIVDSWAAVVE